MRKICVYLVAIALVFNACTGKSSKLSSEDQARNIYQNTMLILTGTMFSSMGSMMGQASAVIPYVADSLEKAVNAKMKDFSNQFFDEMSGKMNQKFDSLKKANPSVYGKLFNNDVMKSVTDKASKAKLPKGFKPLNETLGKEDISRYIIYMSLMDKMDQTKVASDPVMKMYQETFEGMNKLNDAYKNDPEINAFFKSK
jgi:hypothetical protein